MTSVTLPIISLNNLFRLSRDVISLQSLLAFLCHQAAHPGTETTPELAFEYKPSLSKVSDMFAQALGYDNHAHLLERGKTVAGTHYPDFIDQQFEGKLLNLVFTEMSQHFTGMPRSRAEFEMVGQMVNSFCQILSNEASRSLELIVGGSYTGKTLYLVQWLVAYAEANNKETQIPVVVFGLPSLFENLVKQRPDLFTGDQVTHIKVDLDCNNMPSSPTGTQITFIEVDWLTSNEYDDERLYSLASVLAESTNPMWSVFDETMQFTPVVVAFKDSIHNILATEQVGFSNDGQTLFSPTEFTWRLIDPKSLIRFLTAIGSFQDGQADGMAERLMPKHPSGVAACMAHTLVKNSGLLTLPYKLNENVFYEGFKC
ncbi:TPA: hypothetical protein KDZ08_004963 [Vibrio parahaemolyticus]|uniref:hypothetical protein n=1 Tax=Vibrio parahaemolyticus TaxID=670 RepID=UPI001B83613C|nr:hypothetical protein [Vibrio parahaemolyticus]MCR9817907.1 hypothetical protein [Vibrio parahaemolyticus]HBC3540093.1 hypothetical protein [Vibrio parahaemolyticus]HBC3593053.1 hypothetical protein [Vibrio parahaemolyticus]HBC3816476.1 hypothetical protein [Vibrio parahaemolyticus]HBC3917543.1 hypothetical protein [Vibrio parahaemolyticus]